MEFKYANIAISGGVATGNSTLMNQLKPYLEPHGFTLTSIGQLHRQHMKESGDHDQHTPVATNLSDEKQIETEEYVRKLLLDKEKYVIDAWLAGFISRDIPHTLRVLLKIDNKDIQVARFCQRENVSPEKALQSIQDREEQNFTYWKKLYGDYNFWNPDYFQLVLDTGELGVEAVRDRVLEEFGYPVVQ